MNIIYTTFGIVDFRHPAQGLADMSKAGFENISLDISLCCSGYELENYGKNSTGEKNRSTEKVNLLRNPESMQRQFDPMLDRCRRHSLPIQMVRIPSLPWDTKRMDMNPLLEQIAESAIRLCGRIGCRLVLIPPLFSGMERGEEWDVNREYYLRLANTARECRVTILLANQCRSHNGHLLRGICSDSAEAAKWIDRLNAEAARPSASNSTLPPLPSVLTPESVPSAGRTCRNSP